MGEREGEGLVGHDARAATLRKCRRSSVARYLRPQASTSWRSRIRRDISRGVVSAQALLQGPAWGSLGPKTPAIAPSGPSAAGRN